MEHGGNLKQAMTQFGGKHEDWIDLSTGINPVPYDYQPISAKAWTALPDPIDTARLEEAARAFWNIDPALCVLAVPGASAAIAKLPLLARQFFPQVNSADILVESYNEYSNAFGHAGFRLDAAKAEIIVRVHPDNPTGALHQVDSRSASMVVIDESFGDLRPEQSYLNETMAENTIVMKSFGKFWGVAGVRLGFLVGPAQWVEQMRQWSGPWAVSGPALEIALQALCDYAWADQTRERLDRDAQRLDALMIGHAKAPAQGTSLFRLYHVQDAAALQTHLAQYQIWSRVFSYAPHWIRLGLPHSKDFERLEMALCSSPLL